MIAKIIEKTEKWEASIYQSKIKFAVTVVIVSAISYSAAWSLAAIYSCF
jgi:hypothetical protein